MSQGAARKRVLCLIKGLGLGGAERLLADSLEALDRERFDYHFVYLAPWKDFLAGRFREAGFPVHSLGEGARRNYSLLIARLDSLVREERYELIHAHLPVAGILARVVGWRRGIPIVYTEHNLVDRYQPVTAWANRLTYRWNSRVIAVSGEVARSVSEAGLDGRCPVRVVVNGIPVELVKQEASGAEDVREELGIPVGSSVVGTVAVFRRQKRLEDWIDTAAVIVRKRENVVFLLVGHGPVEKELQKKVSALGLDGHILMPGFRPDGRRLLSLMDVFFMSSGYEGLPVTLLEAMALGKPVVATAVGGIPEAVQGGHEGFLLSPGDTAGMAEAILQLLDDGGLRKRMGNRGAQRVERDFDIERSVGLVEEIYREVLAESVP